MRFLIGIFAYEVLVVRLGFLVVVAELVFEEVFC